MSHSSLWGALRSKQGFPGGSDAKASTCQCRRPCFSPWAGTILWSIPTQGSNLRLIAPALAGRPFTTSATWESPGVSVLPHNGSSGAWWKIWTQELGAGIVLQGHTLSCRARQLPPRLALPASLSWLPALGTPHTSHSVPRPGGAVSSEDPSLLSVPLTA